VIGLGRRVSAFAFAEPVDMRKSFDTLSAIVREQVDRDVLDGALFLFVGRDCRRAKVLFWMAPASACSRSVSRTNLSVRDEHCFVASSCRRFSSHAVAPSVSMSSNASSSTPGAPPFRRQRRYASSRTSLRNTLSQSVAAVRRVSGPVC